MNQPRHFFSMLIILLLLPSSLMAQKLTVEGMTLTTDQTANLSENLVQDLNGDYAGLVKVRLTADGAQFEGLVLKKKKHNASEYWVFMAKNSTKLTIIVPGCLPLQVNFPDYGISGIESRYTYLLTLTVPQLTQTGAVDDGMRYLAMTVEPKNSMVQVDGVLQSVDANGEVSVYLPMGRHTYSVSAPGYATKEGSVELSDVTESLRIELTSTHSTLRVECPTVGAQVVVGGKVQGTAPWSGSLAPGNYKVEARLDGYRPQQQSVTLAEKESRTLTFPSLQMITGHLNVDCRPIGSEVLVDGKRVGTSPNVFRNLPIGNHKVEVLKHGYKPLVQTVTICENEQASITGTLTKDSNNVGKKAVKISIETDSLFSFSEESFTASKRRGLMLLADSLDKVGSSLLSDRGKRILRQLCQIIQDEPVCFEIMAHTDSAGSEDDNLSLCSHLAKMVADYLINECKIDSKRIKHIKAMGSSIPIQDNSTILGRKANRRIEIYIIHDSNISQQ